MGVGVGVGAGGLRHSLTLGMTSEGGPSALQGAGCCARRAALGRGCTGVPSHAAASGSPGGPRLMPASTAPGQLHLIQGR